MKRVNIWNSYVLLLLLLPAFCLPSEAWQAGTRRTTDSTGRTTISTYDSSGRVAAVTDELGRASRPGVIPADIPVPAVHANANATSPVVPPLAPATIHVPADQATIQAAIDAAVDGDTVLVADGTYKENINFKGKAITVTSVNGASKTTIDGGGIDSVVTFRTSEGPTSTLNGFTIQNGSSNFSKPNFGDGGGVFIANASPVLTNNVITHNQGCEGAGIFIDFSSPLIQGNTISNNSQAGCSGGVGGGGISVLGASEATIIGNVIANNSMTGSGIGGGGISLFAAGAPVIQNNIFTGNNGGIQGGGIAIVNDASPRIVGNLFIHNSASSGGGLWWLIPTSTPGILLLNNTIAGNTATQGSGIFADGFDSDAVFQNNAIIGIAGITAAFCGTFNNTVPPNFANDDVFTTGSTPYGGLCADQTGVSGNISADPLFVDPSVDNYHLQPASPAIDTGNNAAPIALPATDIAGNPRIVNTTVDIGAFEFQGTTTTSYSSTSLTFATQLTGTTSPTQSVTISNTGATALQIIPFILTGDYSETDTCHTSSGIAVSQSCTITISFTPSASGKRTGQLTVTSNDAASPTVIDLSGTGTAAIVSLSTPSLTFTGQLVGTPSGAQPVTLSNIGDAPLTITGIVASGDFAQTNTCGATVAAGANCTINVTFTPTVRGTRNGAVTITDDAAGSPHSVTLQGAGIGPAATLSPSLTFPGQLTGTTSPAQTVTLSSTGETALTINSIAATGDFGQTNNCPGSLPNGQSCAIQVTFTPAARGARTGTLSVADNSTTSPEQVSLSGTGTAPVVFLSRTLLAFGNQLLNVPVTGTVVLNNIGDAALAITSIDVGGDFSQTNDCGLSLAATSHCTVTVTFTPTALGARLGTLTFTDSALNSPQSVSLSGTGVQIGFSPAGLTFGNQVVGTTSATQTVTMTNQGSSPLSLTGIVPSAGFTQNNNCGASLAANAACTINIAFAPTAAGPLNGLVTVSYAGTQSTVALSGSGLDFTLAAQPGGSTTATIPAGSTATYNLSTSGSSGFNATVNLACSGAPAAANCSVTPPSLTVNGTTPANFSVTVTTTARASLLPLALNLPGSAPPGPGLAIVMLGTVAMLAMAVLWLGRRRMRYAGPAAAFGALLMLLLVAGCGSGGGGSSVTKPPVTGTPAGTSAITVTATSGSATRTLQLTLNVN